jgi:hypothetical protein
MGHEGKGVQEFEERKEFEERGTETANGRNDNRAILGATDSVHKTLNA